MNISERDQWLAAVRDIAQFTRDWYEAFLNQGFSEEDAVYLAAEMIQLMGIRSQ